MLILYLYQICYSNTRLAMQFDIFLFPREREYNLVHAHTNNQISTYQLIAIELLLRNKILISISFGNRFALFQHSLIQLFFKWLKQCLSFQLIFSRYDKSLKKKRFFFQNCLLILSKWLMTN